jgi:hypothetical protein
MRFILLSVHVQVLQMETMICVEVLYVVMATCAMEEFHDSQRLPKEEWQDNISTFSNFIITC